MPKLCKHCSGHGTKVGDLGASRCQMCDGSGFLPFKIGILELYPPDYMIEGPPKPARE